MARMIQVLVIDGDRLERVLLRSLLEPLGFLVLDSEGDVTGRQVLRASACDLVLVDRSGEQAAGVAQLPALLAEFPGIRLIAFVDEAALHPVWEPETGSRVRILRKPVFRQELWCAIQELFPECQPVDADGLGDGPWICRLGDGA